MNISRTLKIGFQHDFKLPEIVGMAYISSRKVSLGQLAITLANYFVKYSKIFERASFVFTQESPDTDVSLFGNINRSVVDIAPQLFLIDDAYRDTVDFSYPTQFSHGTFMIRKPEYKPEVFGIFKTVSLLVWITIITVSFFIFLLYWFVLERKYAYHKVFLHVLAILLRQGSILKPSITAEIILMYSWVFGAMVFCLAYDSVFLSFLTIPPVSKINNVSQLAAAVESGDYHCLFLPGSTLSEFFMTSNERKYRIIGEDLKKTDFLKEKNILSDFMDDRCEQNFAFVADEHIIDYFRVGKKFVSDDRFFGMMSGMMVRKDFCCKKMLETFIHRLMASGMYYKFDSDSKFLFNLPHILKYEEKDNSKRKLTLTDVAPAFIFLLTGYFMSCFTFIAEVLSNRWKKEKYGKNISRIMMRKRKKVSFV